MTIKNYQRLYILIAIYFIGTISQCFAQSVHINNDIKNKKIVFGNEKIDITLDYNKKINISLMQVNGRQVIQGDTGVFAAIKTKNALYSTLKLSTEPVVKTTNNMITISAITYGDKALAINETWIFTISAAAIQLDVSRTLSRAIIAEQIAMPAFRFSNINTWQGAYTDYGGLAWFYLFNQKLETYGVHSSTSQFWNSKTGDGLTIAVIAPGNQVAMDYSRTATDELACTIAIAKKEMQCRYDSGTYRRRFIREGIDVWAPVALSAGKTSQHITLSYFDFNQKYGRGNLKGINGEEVNGVLNTIARIGVIDKQHFGGNSWHTPYGPICLHEQYIAQMGLAINDDNYLKGYQQCLDFYRDNAITPDGRVWPRWAYSNEDAMPNKFTDKGFYEARWGYLLDANPDFVTNVAELYGQTGNTAWVKTQQQACEKALDWILKRDSNNNGLVEMITDSHTQKRGSDWIDIIWASYENAFVNAKLYHALILWAGIEKQLGNTAKTNYYQQFADKLKASFNKPTTAGGFWDDEKQCFIHWRDKDGSTHGNNMVTPVNFMAIAYGICDDEARTKMILDSIETQMQKEQLFFWPLCMYTYAKGEGNDWQFPFPNYENGDIFLSWGAVGVKAYAAYKPELALKYVKNVLAQYAKDGLAFQRYGRTKQDGQGDDILSGNSLSVVGLYQAIYGINPMYNRFYLEPHITKDLAGTQVKYNYRGQKLLIDLDTSNYAVSNGRFKIISDGNFGFYNSGNELQYFKGNDNTAALKIAIAANNTFTLNMKVCGPRQMIWTQSSNDSHNNKITYQLNNCTPNKMYNILVNGNTGKRLKSDGKGILVFDCNVNSKEEQVEVLQQ